MRGDGFDDADVHLDCNYGAQAHRQKAEALLSDGVGEVVASAELRGIEAAPVAVRHLFEGQVEGGFLAAAASSPSGASAAAGQCIVVEEVSYALFVFQKFCHYLCDISLGLCQRRIFFRRRAVCNNRLEFFYYKGFMYV